MKRKEVKIMAAIHKKKSIRFKFKKSPIKLRNVSRKLTNTLSRERRQSPGLRSIFDKEKHKRFVMTKPLKSLKKYKEKYIYEDSMNEIASQLFEQYRDVGVKWSACVHAAKSDWVSSFHTKWGDKLREIKNKEKEKIKD